MPRGELVSIGFSPCFSFTYLPGERDSAQKA